MLTTFGKVLREIRLSRGLLLYDMAKLLGLRCAELSGIEVGRDPLPDEFIEKLNSALELHDYEIKDLHASASLHELEMENYVPPNFDNCL